MHLAIEQARIAESCNEVPIGAVLIDPEGNIKQSSHNLVIGNSDPTFNQYGINGCNTSLVRCPSPFH